MINFHDDSVWVEVEETFEAMLMEKRAVDFDAD